MEINEKLFADALSGELKGTFILKNGFRVKSNRLFDSNSTNCYRYCLKGFSTSFTALGKSSSAGYDIIDFIPDTDVKENELTIEIPEGKEIDWDESKKQNKIVLKDKQLTYKDICKKMFKNGSFFIDAYGYTKNQCVLGILDTGFNLACTEKQLACILAKNALANTAVYLNNGWTPNLSENFTVYTPYYNYGNNSLAADVENAVYAKNKGHIIFKSEELVHQAFKILGEETVKLALTPLGI